MPLNEFEQTSIQSVLAYLGERSGSSWAIEQVLEDQYRSEPVPEVRVSDGRTTAAIEVKELIAAAGRQFG